MDLGELLLGGVAVVELAHWAVPWPAAYRPLFERYAKPGTRITPELLQAIAWKESGFNPRAVSPANANGTRDYGLMQINSANLAHFGLTPETALNPEASVKAAAALLAELEPHARSVGDLFSMYNAGQRPGGGPRHGLDGAYVNADYVTDAYGKWLVLRLGSFAPIQRRSV